MMRTIDVDLLIIGAGGAGLVAAITAHDAGLKTLVVGKVFLGRGGCSSILGATGSGVHAKSVAREVDTAFADRVKYFTHYLGDQDYMKQTAAAGPEIMNMLEGMGLYFRRNDDGEFIAMTRTGYGLLAPKWGNTGKGVMDILRSQIFARGVPAIEEATATNLLTSDGEVTGAMVYDYSHAILYAVRAKAVILATGDVDFLWRRSTATREQSGNGLAMAFRAGAELESLEQKWWHIGDIARPAAWQRFHLYPNPIPMSSEVGHYYNSSGEFFFHSTMYPNAQPSYYLQCKHLAREVQKGLARPDGGYFVSYAHVDPGVMKEYGLIWGFLEQLGYDPRRDRVECAMSCHQMRGGIRFSPKKMTTNVPGLFVAGSVAASYLSGILQVSWEGKRAVAAARERIAGMPALSSSPDQERAEEARLQALLDRRHDRPVLPAAVKRAIRDAMTTYMPYAKTEQRMRAGLDEIRRISSELVPRMVVPSGSRRFDWDLVEALDVGDMLTCCELDIRSALERKESRGGFYREDYPFTDHAGWLKKIVLAKGEEDGDPRIAFVPVDLPYVSPPTAKEDFLTSES